MHFFGPLVKNQPAVGTLFLTAHATPTGIYIDFGFAAGMLLFLPRTGTTSHTNIFDGAAEAGHLVTFKMGQADKYIGIHHSPANFGFFHIFAALYRDFHIVCALQTITNEDGTACR